MTSRTEPLWFALLVVGIVVLSVGKFGIDKYSAAVALSERADSVAKVHAAEAELMAEANARLAADLERLAETRAADSVRWEQARAEDRARAARARERAERSATDLVASLDSVQASQFAEYAAQRDTVEDALRSELATERADNASLRVMVTTLTARVGGLEAEIVPLRAQVSALQESAGFKDAALKAKGRENTYIRLAVVLAAVKIGYDTFAGAG